MKLTGGETVVKSLLREGVEVVFGIPGVHTLDIYDAFLDNPELKHIVVRHEQGASFMADGYARATGKVGVCVLITGPGLTNAATGIAQAFSDSSPVLVLSSQNPTDHIDQQRGLLHDLKDQSRMMDSICAYSETVYGVRDIPEAIARAFRYFETHRPQPVHLEFPTDVLESTELVEFEATPRQATPPTGDHERLEQVAEALVGAKRPLLVVGGGAHDAAAEVLHLAELVDMPVVSTTNGKGVFPETHRLALGANLRSSEACEFISERDVVLAVGTELSVHETDRGSLTFGEELYHIDIDSRNFGKNHETELGIVGKAQPTLGALSKLIEGRIGEAIVRAEQDELQTLHKELIGFDRLEQRHWRNILRTIKETLDEDAVLVNDMTTLCYRATGAYPVEQPRSFLFPRGFGTLGFSVPAAFGAKIGQPNRQVVALVGDGGFMFTSAELATAVKYELGVPVIIFNNDSYGVVRSIQLRKYERSTGCDIVNPDFVEYARSFGAHAQRIDAEEVTAELPGALGAAFGRKVPTVIELPIES